jgi:pyridoxamine 5'-phosphate oxidase
MAADLAAIRTEYARAGLVEGDLDPSPAKQVERWVHDAVAAGHPEPTAMTLATATPDGQPAARVVLLKDIDDRGVVFYTNYESDKGKQLGQNPRACANLFWVLLERQARITGSVEKTSREDSEAYFRSRPRESQLGAWASEQSSVLQGRADLDERLARVRARFGDGPIECPPFWGGYRLVFDSVELWQGRPSRLHDRLRYTRMPDRRWKIERLSP